MPAFFQSHAANAEPLRHLDVRADDSDADDYVFRPSLAALPRLLDPRRRREPTVLDQGSEGACVGFALAAVIHTGVGLRRPDTPSAGGNGGAAGPAPALGEEDLVSERMLYEMARRYDEWSGENYEGSSLRGAMKGWHKHGAASRGAWPTASEASDRRNRRWMEDARRRPLGAYYRIVDSDVGHLQAALFEGDAVLASLWVHPGWRGEALEAPQAGDVLGTRRIRFGSRATGLHAVALVGYGPEGFLVQNSWGRGWGTAGFAVLTYTDWMANRQDAWVARPGPQTWDHARSPAIFHVGFEGGRSSSEGPAGAVGLGGLDVPREALTHIVRTGDRGALSTGGRFETRAEDLPRMASLARYAPARDGFRDIVLYAHGGLVSETTGALTAGRLWELCEGKGLLAYFFVWETGITESLLGWLRSHDDAAGPRAGIDLGALWQGLKKGTKKALVAAQRLVGRALAPAARAEWGEMHGRARGSATPKGGAGLFLQQLFSAMAEARSPVPFRLHLVGHSAGAIYLAELYEGCLKRLLDRSDRAVRLGSVHFLAPALSVPEAARIFAPEGSLPVDPREFTVHTLSDEQEASDQIGIYPSSLLTYVADLLEGGRARTPILGIRRDLRRALRGLGSPTLRLSGVSTRHGDFDDSGHEVEEVLSTIASGSGATVASPDASSSGEESRGPLTLPVAPRRRSPIAEPARGRTGARSKRATPSRARRGSEGAV